MKCILKIFLILFVLSSCTKQEPISQPINLNNLIVTSKSVIPVEDALRNLQTLLDGAKGHAWVIDGLLVYKYIFYTATLYNLFHINWGWNGTNDGYFEQGVFDMTNRHSIETGFDSGANSTQSSNYTWNYRIITYSLY